MSRPTETSPLLPSSSPSSPPPSHPPLQAKIRVETYSPNRSIHYSSITPKTSFSSHPLTYPTPQDFQNIIQSTSKHTSASYQSSGQENSQSHSNSTIHHQNEKERERDPQVQFDGNLSISDQLKNTQWYKQNLHVGDDNDNDNDHENDSDHPDLNGLSDDVTAHDNDIDDDDDLDTQSFHEKSIKNRISFAIKISLWMNILLFVSKCYVVYFSRSLAVAASAVDSFLDLLSQLIIVVSEYSMANRDKINYPAGKSRMEPIGVILCAAAMGMASLQLIMESGETIVIGFTDPSSYVPTVFDQITLIVLISTIVLKIFLYFYCNSLSSYSSNAMALAVDHRNDVITNCVAILSALLSVRFPLYWYCDPIAAILMSLYITFNWISIGREQMYQLVGKAADDEFINDIRQLSSNHHPLLIPDIIRAYHFGYRYLVELEVILPAEMTVRESHDISLALQQQVEQLDNVERCFVHVDHMQRNVDEHDWIQIKEEKRKSEIRKSKIMRKSMMNAAEGQGKGQGQGQGVNRQSVSTQLFPNDDSPTLDDNHMASFSAIHGNHHSDDPLAHVNPIDTYLQPHPEHPRSSFQQHSMDESGGMGMGNSSDGGLQAFQQQQMQSGMGSITVPTSLSSLPPSSTSPPIPSLYDRMRKKPERDFTLTPHSLLPSTESKERHSWQIGNQAAKEKEKIRGSVL